MNLYDFVSNSGIGHFDYLGLLQMPPTTNPLVTPSTGAKVCTRVAAGGTRAGVVGAAGAATFVVCYWISDTFIAPYVIPEPDDLPPYPPRPPYPPDNDDDDKVYCDYTGFIEVNGPGSSGGSCGYECDDGDYLSITRKCEKDCPYKGQRTEKRIIDFTLD